MVDALNKFKLEAGLPRKAACVIIMRKTSKIDNYKILMMKRKQSLSFGNQYAFPGGCLESQDYKVSGQNNWHDAARYAALRELYEETGLILAKKKDSKEVMKLKNKNIRLKEMFQVINIPIKSFCRPILRLITPQSQIKRWDTIFYLILADESNQDPDSPAFYNLNAPQDITNIDDLDFNKEEADSYSWDNANTYINQHQQKKIQIAMPQQVILKCLSKFKQESDIEYFFQRLQQQSSNNKDIGDYLSKESEIFPFMFHVKNLSKDPKIQHLVWMTVPDPRFPIQSIIEKEPTGPLKDEFKEKYNKVVQYKNQKFAITTHMKQFIFEFENIMFFSLFNYLGEDVNFLNPTSKL